jgi:hypothetical protein
LVSSHRRPEIAIYPDADKIGIGEHLPRWGRLRAFFRRDDARTKGGRAAARTRTFDAGENSVQDRRTAVA